MSEESMFKGVMTYDNKKKPASINCAHIVAAFISNKYSFTE